MSSFSAMLAAACLAAMLALGATGPVKRADDSDPTNAVVAQLSSRLATLEASVEAGHRDMAARLGTLERKVAFKVTFSDSHAVPYLVPYKFDSVVFNDGNGWDPALGVFTAPYAGVYVFVLQVFTRAAGDDFVDLMVNGNIAIRMKLGAAAASDSLASSSTVKLAAGDKVWVQDPGDPALDLYGYNHSFFCGFLLY